MTTTPDIEAIVRDVLRRLAPATGPVAPAHRPPVGEQQRVNQPAANQPASGELALTEQVVTVDSLRGRLSGIKRLVVARGTLITPLAADELRQRGIALQRGDAAPAPTSHTKPTEIMVATLGRHNAGGLARQLAAGEPQEYSELAAALVDMAAAIEGGGRAILLSDTPAQAVCQANRREPLRAAWAIDVASARDAVASASANLLVLEPRRHSLMQMVNMGRAFRLARPE